MTIFKWFGIFFLCALANFLVAYFMFSSFWAFVVLTVFELGFFIYYQHRLSIYEDGLVAISPKKLFKIHTENFGRQIDDELDLRKNQNEKDLDIVLHELNNEFALGKEKYDNITNEITTFLNTENEFASNQILNKIEQYQKSLETQKDALEKTSQNILKVQKEIERLTVSDQKAESKKVDRMVSRLEAELDLPNTHVEKRVLQEFDILTARIEKYRTDLEKRLSLRHEKKRDS